MKIFDKDMLQQRMNGVCVYVCASMCFCFKLKAHEKEWENSSWTVYSYDKGEVDDYIVVNNKV